MTHSGAQQGTGSRFIVGLDGLRALAVVAVLAYHLLPGMVPGGYIGVDIFFVISGFLITTLLLSERTRMGKIHFKKFWLRRARRLLPALFVTIVVTSAAALFVRGDMLVGLGRQILGAITFSNNWVEVAAGANYFDADNTHLFTNFWSLAVEEQFYLVWPFILTGLLFIPGLRRNPKVGTWICGILATSSAVLMAVMFSSTSATRVYYGTDTHVFGLMIGAALAFWAQSRVSATAQRRLYQPFWSLDGSIVQQAGIIALVGLGILMFTMSDTSPFAYYGGLFLASVLGAVVIVATIARRSLLQRIFTFRPLEWIGVRSYGIYLWHWPLLILLTHAFPVRSNQLAIAGITLGATIIIAAASYRFLELPIQQLGFRVFLSRGMRRQVIRTGTAAAKWRIRPHPVFVGSLVLVILAMSAVITAPSKTQAQLRIEAGQRAIAQAQHSGSVKSQVLPAQTANPADKTIISAAPKLPKAAVITGDDMTIIGDSVTIASAPALQARYPGILIDAEISRSLREGGFDAIDKLVLAGQLRNTVVIALATNGYFGNGNLDTLIEKLGQRTIVFVTAHANREWTDTNNADVHAQAKKHPNVTVAEWNDAISAHPEDVGDDNIHPNTQGGEIYADCIAAALIKR